MGFPTVGGYRFSPLFPDILILPLVSFLIHLTDAKKGIIRIEFLSATSLMELNRIMTSFAPKKNNKKKALAIPEVGRGVKEVKQ